MDTDNYWTASPGSVLDCENCHSASFIGGQLLGAHQGHITTIPPLDATECENCHEAVTNSYTGDIGTNGHGNELRELNAAQLTYSTATRQDLTGTCNNTSCHNSGAEPSAAWNATLLACDDCHYYAASPVSGDNLAHRASLTGPHSTHFAASAITSCDECHTANAGDTTLTHVMGVSLTSRANAARDDVDIIVTPVNDPPILAIEVPERVALGFPTLVTSTFTDDDDPSEGTGHDCPQRRADCDR